MYRTEQKPPAGQDATPEVPAGALAPTVDLYRVLDVVLSLAALLFLVTEELLTEAHEETETPLLTLSFFVGFLLFLLLGMVA